MVVLTVLLAVLSAVLIIKVYVLRRSAREIAEAFSDCLKTDTNNLITVSSSDKQVRRLVKQLNDELKLLTLCGTNQRIPLLTEVLEVYAGRGPLIVELKSGRRNSAKDADAITSVLKEYSDRLNKRKKEAGKERPSILNKLKKFKEIVANAPLKHREKRKEQER